MSRQRAMSFLVRCVAFFAVALFVTGGSQPVLALNPLDMPTDGKCNYGTGNNQVCGFALRVFGRGGTSRSQRPFDLVGIAGALRRRLLRNQRRLDHHRPFQLRAVSGRQVHVYVQQSHSL
jgi:hypothetical protein